MRRASLPALGAGELATLVLEFGYFGISQRERGRCIGENWRGCFDWSSGEFQAVPPTTRWDRWRRSTDAATHVRRGHHDGCREFGVSLEALAAHLPHHDSNAAAEYLLDGFTEAIHTMQQLDTARVPWDAAEAREVLEISLRKRITPSPFPVPQQAIQKASRLRTQKTGRKLREAATRFLSARN